MPPSGRPDSSLPGVPASELLARGGTLVTATHRLARHLRRAHDRSMAARGAQAWPSADILPLDAWLRRTWETLAVQGHPLGRQRLLTDAECQLIWNQVMAGEPAGVLPTPVAPLAAASWRLCQLWGITPPALHQSADTDDARAFARWTDGYRRMLAERGWTDGMALLAGLPAVLEEPATAAMLLAGSAAGFAGFSPMPPAVAALAAALERCQATVCNIVATPMHRSTRLVAARDEEDELARAFNWAAELLGREPDASVAIVVGNLEAEAARARRIGLHMLAPGWQLDEPASRPVALAAGRQLTDYPVVGTALALLRLLGQTSNFEEASHLLRSPHVKGAAVERTGRALGELQLREQPMESTHAADLAGRLRRPAPVLAALWTAAATLSEAARNQRWLPSRWAGHFDAWLTAAGWPGDRGLDSEEHQAAEAWQLLLSAFAATDAVAGRLPLHAALDQLAMQARNRAFEPEAASGAVQVLDLREAGGHSFDGLWITGLTADQWPAPARAHALVPLHLQRAAGIPEAAAASQQRAIRQRLAGLIAATGEVVLSWPRESEGGVRLPSPLLDDQSITGTMTQDQSEAGALSGHPLRAAITAQALAPGAGLANVPDPAPVLASTGSQPATRVPGGSRVLAMQAVCPARAFVEFRLQGRELRSPARLLDAARRGLLLHRTLERLYALEACRAGLGSLETPALRELYDSVIDTVLDDFLPRGDAFAAGLRALEAERLWPQVEALRLLDAERPAFTVETEVSRDVRIGALGMKLRLDRIDHAAGGGELVIDYKTGRFEPGGWKKHRLQDSQLPLYAVTEGAAGIAVVQFAPTGIRMVGVGDAALGIAGVKMPQKFFKPWDAGWPAVLHHWRQQLEALAAEFAGGDFRVNPADRTHATGQFAAITRIFEFANDDGLDEASTETDA